MGGARKDSTRKGSSRAALSAAVARKVSVSAASGARKDSTRKGSSRAALSVAVARKVSVSAASGHVSSPTTLAGQASCTDFSSGSMGTNSNWAEKRSDNAMPAVASLSANSMDTALSLAVVHSGDTNASPVAPAVVSLSENSVRSLPTSLKRTCTSMFTAMLLVKTEPANWSSPLMLLHFIEQCRTSTVFRISGDARAQFSTCEVFRVYNVEVPASCVQNASGAHKYGVKARYEVVLKYPVKKLELSRVAWPVTFPYEFLSWRSLNQLPTNSVIDLLGMVLQEPERDVNSSFPKVLVQLSNCGLVQEVALLGSQAATGLAPGSIVAFSGLSLREYQGDRSLQTMFLTVIEVNPDLSHLRATPEQDFSEGHKRKAILISPRVVIPISEVDKISKQLVSDAKKGEVVVATECTLCGTLSKISDKFFEDDPPIVLVGNKEVMCWKTQLQDATGSMTVTVWNKACFALFGVSVDKMREYWRAGHECRERQSEMIHELNAKLRNEVVCNCTVDVWSYGRKVKKHEPRIHINGLDVKGV